MNSANNKVDELVDIICRLLIAEANTGRERERERVGCNKDKGRGECDLSGTEARRGHHHRWI